jgi:Hexameric tyrosine-coordinated heme protein (HTHP)
MCAMALVPPEPLVPNNTLITPRAEEGRVLAITLARHSIPAMQKELEVLQSRRVQYAHDHTD